MPELEITDALTLIDLSKRILGKRALPLMERLSERNDFWRVAQFIECNKPTSHVVSYSIKLPTGTRTKLNTGIPYEVGLSGQDEEALEGIETLCKVDCRILQGIENQQKVRAGLVGQSLEGIAQTAIGDVFYGNSASDPTQIDGIMTRLSAVADANVIDEGGSGSDCTSVIVMGWGPDKCHMIYPKDAGPTGLKAVAVEDLGRQLVSDGTNDFLAWVSYLAINFGFVVNDPRYIVRIGSIETSGSANILDVENLVKAINYMPDKKGACILMNGDQITALEIDAMARDNVEYTPAEPYGEGLARFKGVPLIRCDAITNVEAAI